MSGVKLSGRIKSFDKYSVVLETNNQEQLIFKHAISTVVVSRPFHRPGALAARRRTRSCSWDAGRAESPSRKAGVWPQEIALLVGLKLSGRKARSQDARSASRAISAEESLEELASWRPRRARSVAERSIQTRPRADAATLIGSGKVEELKAQIHFHDASRGGLRPGTDAHAAAQSGARAGRKGARPDAADPGHFRPARANPRRTVAGRAGAAELSAAAVDRPRRGHVAAGRRTSARAVRAKPNSKPTGGGFTSAFRPSSAVWSACAAGAPRSGNKGRRFRWRPWRWWATPTPENRRCSTG